MSAVNLAEAARFLDIMVEGEPITLQTFDDDAGRKAPGLARIRHGDLDQHAAELQKLNAQGAGIFWMVNRGNAKGRSNVCVTGIRALFLDLDGAPLQPVLNAGVQPHAVVESSPGRWHCYWLVSGCPLGAFGTAQKALAAKFGGDPSVCDLARVMRVPGFLHRKAEPFATRIESMEPMQPYAFDDLVQRLGLDVIEAPAQAPAPTPPAQSGTDARKVPPGGRHAHLVKWAGQLNWRGMPAEVVRVAVQHENVRVCDPPKTTAEVDAVVADVLKRYAGQHGRDNTPPKLPHVIATAAQLMDADFPPLLWCVPDILPEGTYLLSAKPKVGKSWLALQMGYGIASAGVVLGKKVEGGSVLVLALEDNKRRLKSRLEKLGAFMFPDRTQLGRLHVETEWPRVHEGGAEAIEEWLKATPDARLVVIDTLAKFRPTTGGRASAYEQDYQALAPVKALSDKYRVTVLVVTHNRKMESEDALDLISGTMGLSGGCDGALVIERERASPTAKLHLIGRDIENDGCFAIEFHKSNCTWSMVGDASVVTKSREREQLMQVFKDERRPLSRKEVIELSGRKAGTVGRLIAAMVNDGNLTRTDDGCYFSSYTPEQGEKSEQPEQGEQGEQTEQGEQQPLCSPVRPVNAVRPVRPVRPRQHKKPATHGQPI